TVQHGRPLFLVILTELNLDHQSERARGRMNDQREIGHHGVAWIEWIVEFADSLFDAQYRAGARHTCPNRELDRELEVLAQHQRQVLMQLAGHVRTRGNETRQSNAEAP